jgi:hypothetical protein
MQYKYSLHGHAVTVASSPEAKNDSAVSFPESYDTSPDAGGSGVRDVKGIRFTGEAGTYAWFHLPCPLPHEAYQYSQAISALEIRVGTEGVAFIDKVYILNAGWETLFLDKNLQVDEIYSKVFDLPLPINGAFAVCLRVHFSVPAKIRFLGSSIALALVAS